MRKVAFSRKRLQFSERRIKAVIGRKRHFPNMLATTFYLKLKPLFASMIQRVFLIKKSIIPLLFFDLNVNFITKMTLPQPSTKITNFLEIY